MRYFLIAGEPSGDIHGAALITALRQADADAEIRFFGGDKMAAAAGTEPVVHYRQMAYMGFSEVIRHLPDVRRNLNKAREEIRRFRPEAIILIDYPSFNLRIARFARPMGVKVYYYISPKVWAWKEWRVKSLRRDVDRLFSILPFEVPFFRRHGMEVKYVGNPSVAEVAAHLAEIAPDDSAFRADHQLDPSKPLLALLPGSRASEIRNNLPVMAAVAARHPECQAVIAGAPSLSLNLYREHTALPVLQDATFELLRYSRAALVTSGTATLETALVGTPQVVCYRANGSRLSYSIMSRLLKVKFVTLPNLIVDRAIIPEMLLHHCNVAEVDSHLAPLLDAESAERAAQMEGYERMRSLLGTADPARATAAAIVADLK